MKELATKFKARGKDGEGQIHTGWLSVYFLKGELKTYIQEEAEENKPAMTFYVEPESVAQFVGYDSDGKEVYEGDELIDNYGESFSTAAYIGLESKKSFMIACDVGDTILGYRRQEFNFKLEEGGNDNL